jgi:hypothetical protein
MQQLSKDESSEKIQFFKKESPSKTNSKPPLISKK